MKRPIKKLKKYWKELCLLEDAFHLEVCALEREMELDTGIEGVEFFQSDGGYCGIGTIDRKMKLIQEDKLGK